MSLMHKFALVIWYTDCHLFSLLRCNCTDGWKGLLCGDEVTVCDPEHPTPHSCAEGSVCSPLPVGFECHCPLGKNGTLCDEG